MKRLMQRIKTYMRPENVIILLISLAIALLAIVLSYNFTQKRLNRYDGLPDTDSGFPMRAYDWDNLYQDEFNFRSYEDDAFTARRGIDVSEHQGEIDWSQVKESGVEFAYLRLGYRSYQLGGLHLDTRFEEYAAGLKENDIDLGVYFFSQAVTVEEAKEEAQFVLDHLHGLKVKMPIAFDMEAVVEGEENRIKDLSMEEKTVIADAFCTILENHGYETCIYGNPYWIYENLNLSLLTHRHLWLAHYVQRTSFPYDFRLWQYTEGGIVGGISNPVDLDIQFLPKQNG